MSLPTNQSTEEDKPVRLQFESTSTIEEIAQKTFGRLHVHGHRAIYKTAIMIVAKLVEESYDKGFIRIRIGDCGMLEIERNIDKPIEPAALPIGRASKTTRLEQGMQPDSQG